MNALSCNHRGHHQFNRFTSLLTPIWKMNFVERPASYNLIWLIGNFWWLIRLNWPFPYPWPHHQIMATDWTRRFQHSSSIMDSRTRWPVPAISICRPPRQQSKRRFSVKFSAGISVYLAGQETCLVELKWRLVVRQVQTLRQSWYKRRNQ